MAFEQPGFSFTLPAGADFSAGAQFRFCDVNSSGKAVNPTAGGSAVGVRQTKSATNAACTIIHSGISFVEVSAAVTCGALLKTDANGCALTATTGTTVLGRALETATASGQQIAVLLTNHNAATA